MRVCIVAAILLTVIGLPYSDETSAQPHANESVKSFASQHIKIVHGPRLGVITKSEATISWDTDTSEKGYVEYYTTSPQHTGRLYEDKSTKYHRVTLQGLQPDTVYHYKIGTGKSKSLPRSFKTAPAAQDAVFHFISMADNRGQSDNSDMKSLPQAFLNIMADAQKKAKDPSLNVAFAFNAGDLFFGYTTKVDKSRKLYSSFKNATDNLAGMIPFLFSPGNHEMAPVPLHRYQHEPGFDPLAVWNEQFAQPAPLKGYEGTVFSWYFGNSFFVSLDSCHYSGPGKPNAGFYVISDAQLTWLENELKAAQANKVRHIFIFSHAQAYNKDANDKEGTHLGCDRDDKQCLKFWNVLERYNVDAYICGHSHKSNFFQPSNGLVYQWLNGDSGCVDEGEKKSHYTLWKIDGDVATAELLDETGKPVDKPLKINSRQPK